VDRAGRVVEGGRLRRRVALRVGDEEARLRVGEVELELLLRVGRVERRRHAARADHRQEHDHQLYIQIAFARASGPDSCYSGALQRAGRNMTDRIRKKETNLDGVGEGERDDVARENFSVGGESCGRRVDESVEGGVRELQPARYGNCAAGREGGHRLLEQRRQRGGLRRRHGHGESGWEREQSGDGLLRGAVGGSLFVACAAG
jgi:hypothetical protein